MSETFSRMRPVETILCGPAASVLGGAHLTDERDSMIVDIGSQPPDAFPYVKGRAARPRDGRCSISGRRRVPVKGNIINPSPSGGDGALRQNGTPLLGERRVVPSASAGRDDPPSTVPESATPRPASFHALPRLLVRDIPNSENSSENELAFYSALRTSLL